ncbi:hypothetical protein ATCCBAA256_29420 [Mycobacterium montefiorense]|nr:hypothetical protein ATCCBAA256_29420 [Mycobacterium montefiorense]
MSCGAGSTSAGIRPVALKSCHNTTKTNGDEIRMMAHRRCLRGLATAAAGSASAPVSMGVLTIIGRTFAEIRE